MNEYFDFQRKLNNKILQPIPIFHPILPILPILPNELTNRVYALRKKLHGENYCDNFCQTFW